MAAAFDFVANCGDGVFVVNRRQEIVLWNRAATRILRYPQSEVVGRRCFEVLGGRDHAGCVFCRKGCETVAAADRCQFPGTRDLCVRANGGHQTWVNMSTIVLPSGNGAIHGLVHVFREVTRRHEVMRLVTTLVDVVTNGDGKATTARPGPGASGNGSGALTRREREVLELLAEGQSTAQIAASLHLSRRTVGNHVSNLLAKLGVHSRIEAVVRSMDRGII